MSTPTNPAPAPDVDAEDVVTMTEKMFELRLQESTTVGKAVGFQLAADECEREAAQHFLNRRDEIARILRDMAAKFDKLSKEQREKQNQIKERRNA